MQRIILHLDLDYFYAQIEEARKPEIKNKPVVVCQYSGRSEDSGAVATTNYIARKFNVKSGLPIKTAKKLLQSTDSVFISANHELYESISETIMNIIRKYSDKFEQLSIDEACIDISNKTHDDYQKAKIYGNELKEEISANVEAVRTALNGDDVSQIKSSMETLQESMQKVGTLIYGEQGEGTPDTQTTPEQENQESDSSDTVEGEYREV